MNNSNFSALFLDELEMFNHLCGYFFFYLNIFDFFFINVTLFIAILIKNVTLCMINSTYRCEFYSKYIYMYLNFNRWPVGDRYICFVFIWQGDRRCRDRMVVGITTTCVISAYHHLSCEFESCSGEVYSIQHYVIKFVSDVRQVSVFSGYFGFIQQ